MTDEERAAFNLLVAREEYADAKVVAAAELAVLEAELDREA